MLSRLINWYYNSLFNPLHAQIIYKNIFFLPVVLSVDLSRDRLVFNSRLLRLKSHREAITSLTKADG